MDLKQYLRVFRQQWWLIVLCLALGLGAAAAYTFTQTPKYAAHTQVYISTGGQNTAQAAYQGGLSSQERASSYAQIVVSNKVVSAVQGQLDVPGSVKQLQSEISASSPQGTALVNVTVTDTSAVRARDIANALGAQLSLLVNNLESPPGQKVSPVKVTTVEAAIVPSSPVSPNKFLDLTVGLILGLALGVGTAVLRETLRAGFSERDEAAEIAGAPVLATLPVEPRLGNHPLVVEEASFSPMAEALRQLRTSMGFLGVDGSIRSLVVTSSVEGEGKTTVAANLAVALAQTGEQVILVDAELRKPGIGALLGIDTDYGLTSVLVGTTHLDQALWQWDTELSLQVLPSGLVPPNPSEMLASQRMREVLVELRKRATVVIFDAPPLLPVTDAAVLANLTDGAVLVTLAGKTRRQDLALSAETLRHIGAHVLGVVLNRTPGRRKYSGLSPRVSSLKQQSRLRDPSPREPGVPVP